MPRRDSFGKEVKLNFGLLTSLWKQSPCLSFAPPPPCRWPWSTFKTRGRRERPTTPTRPARRDSHRIGTYLARIWVTYIWKKSNREKRHVTKYQWYSVVSTQPKLLQSGKRESGARLAQKHQTCATMTHFVAQGVRKPAPAGAGRESQAVISGIGKRSHWVWTRTRLGLESPDSKGLASPTF